MSESVRVERGRYHDSVTLMRASAAASDEPGVETVIAAMATPLNRDQLAGAGFPLPEAGPDDLVIAVRAAGDAAVEAAVAAVERVLAERRRPAPGGAARVPPHTVEAAASERPDAGVVVVSVPGPHAYVEAVAALRAGRHVMVFSDGVDLAAEVALKREGTARGRLVMGPDCGTVILAGAGLGFANVVVPGPVGLVAASGTGAQQLCGLLDGAGIGVRHVLGVGGRDLSAAVGGISALAALAALDADPEVEVIALVSKPPAPDVADAVAAAAAACATPGRAGARRAGVPHPHRRRRRDRPHPGAAVPRAHRLGPGAGAAAGTAARPVQRGDQLPGGPRAAGGADRPGAVERPPGPRRATSAPATTRAAGPACSTWATTSSRPGGPIP